MRAFVSLVNRLQQKFGIAHRKLVFIEGGLGSQILNIIFFWNLQERFGSSTAKCNLSYFRDENSKSHWSWELAKFNILLSDLEKYEAKNKLNLLIPKKDWINQNLLNANYWQTARNSYIDRFSFNEGMIRDYFENLIEKPLPLSFGAVHVRRGDYLEVASKIVSSAEYFDFLEKISNVFPDNVFFASDSLFTVEEKTQILEIMTPKRNVIFLDDPKYNSFNIHCLFRLADVLITSNSTYSFSAGLLGKRDQKVFAPLNFHFGPDAEKYNTMFQSVSDFVVWRSFN
jgi:hypothetical protein